MSETNIAVGLKANRPPRIASLAKAALAWTLVRVLDRSQSRDPVESANDRRGALIKPQPVHGPDKPGWLGVILGAYVRINRHRVFALSAGVTFYGLLALFPAVAAFVSLYGFFADPKVINAQLVSLSAIVPEGAIQLIQAEVTSIGSAGGGSLSLGFFVGFLTALWSANAGSKAIFDALNVVYGEDEKRSFIRLTLVSLAVTCCTLAFLALVVTAVVAIPIALNFLGAHDQAGWVLLFLTFLRWPALLVLVALGLAVVYRIGPSHSEPRWRWVTPGSALASFVWLGASMLFSWYVSNFGNYNKTYGSLGAAVGFMTWMWISGIIVLSGAEIDAQRDQQRLAALRGAGASQANGAAQKP